MRNIASRCIVALLVVSLFVSVVPFAAAQSASPEASPTESPSPTASPVPSQDVVNDIQKKIDELQSKLNEIRKEKNSLSSEIKFFDNKILLNEKQIEKTELEIRITESEIADLGERIAGLKTTLTELSSDLIVRVQSQYKQKAIDPISRMFATTGIADFFKEDKYREKVRAHTQDLLVTTEVKRQNYDEEKTVKEDKQIELETLKSRLASQRTELSRQKDEKRKLLVQTNNNESNYQSLLAAAQAELASLRRFTAGRGGLLSPQNSPDGWFYSQRDERWGNYLVGTHPAGQYSVLDAGCLISSIAMVKKKFGEDVTPLHIASNPGYFDTYYTSRPPLPNRPYPAPSGYRYTYGNYSTSLIDNNLEQGRPVIVKLSVRVSGGNSTHFIVLKDGRNGDYVMHDSWEGYDKKFADFYSPGQVMVVAYLVNS